MRLQSRFQAGLSGFRSPRLAKTRAPSAAEALPAIVKPVALDCGDSLRIRSGRGTRLRVASGVLWVTEENSLEDHVLLPGDAVELAQSGRAVILAHRVARLVVEVPAGVPPPRAVEMALARDAFVRRIVLPAATPISRHTVGTTAAGLLRRMASAIRSIAGMPGSSRTIVPTTGTPRTACGA